MRNKIILAIETSGELCSVSLSFDKITYDERNVNLKHIHSERLIPIIEELLRSNKIEVSDLYCIAISIGPGSFTGLRIGMTAAKGIAFASNKPIVPVPTFDALALEVSEYLQVGDQFEIINNANIDECYYAKYSVEEKKISIIAKAQLKSKKGIEDSVECKHIFGNVKFIKNIKNISSPRASSVAKWTYIFGEDLLTFDYDYLEPNYLKKFKVKINK